MQSSTGTSDRDDIGDIYKLLLDGDTALSFFSLVVPNEGTKIYVNVFLDGVTATAIPGETCFLFNITENGFEPLSTVPSSCFSSTLDNKPMYCTYWVLRYGNMDYLKADATGKCPNGNQLSKTLTSCN